MRSISASAASSVSSAGERRSTWSSHRSGDDVGPRAAVHDADVHGDAGPTAVQPLQRDDRVRRLEHRVAALLRLDAGVRRPPVIVDPVVGDPLASADDVAVRPRTLQDERRVVLRRQLADDRTGERRPDLLVGVADVRDGAEPVEAGLLQDLGRDEPGRAARPSCPRRPDRGRCLPRCGTVVRRPCPRRRPCPCGPRAARSGPPAPRRRADHEVAQLRRIAVAGAMRTTLHLPAVRPEPRFAQVGDRVHARRGCTSRSRRSPSLPAPRRTRRSGERRSRVGSQRPRGAV